VLLAAAATSVRASPVEASDPTAPLPPPAELALRWTMNSVASFAPALPAAAANAPQLPTPRAAGRTLMMPSPVGADAGVPDPAAYALMGLLLVGAGLLVRHWRHGATGSAQRGASKKT
jgi:hypothetical protein